MTVVITKACSIDLQKVLVSPTMLQCKSSFLINRLVILNQTFDELKSKNPSYCVMGYETISGQHVEDKAYSTLSLLYVVHSHKIY